jgi:hypothetical protein
MPIPVQESQFQISNVLYPLPTSTGNSSLQDADSCIFWLLDFCAGVLQANAGARWEQEVLALQANGFAQNISTTFVSPTRVGYNPIPFLKASNYQFPLLALYRADNGSIREKSITAFVEFEQDLELLFILPPMKAEEMEHLNPFLNAAKDIIGQKNEHGYDPNWNDGLYIGPLANYEKVAAKTFSLTSIPDTGTDLVMPTLIVGIRLWERNIAVPGTIDPTPADLSGELNLQTPDGYYYPDGYVQNDFIGIDGYYFPPPFGQ